MIHRLLIDAVSEALASRTVERPADPGSLAHLPLYLWRLFEMRLTLAQEHGSLSQDVYDRIVTHGLGPARLDPTGRIVLEEDILPFLAEVLNTLRRHGPPVTTAGTPSAGVVRLSTSATTPSRAISSAPGRIRSPIPSSSVPARRPSPAARTPYCAGLTTWCFRACHPTKPRLPRRSN